MDFWKSALLFALACLALAGGVRGQFTDDFSDGDFTQNPVWTGDDTLFVIDDGVLRSNRTGAFVYQLSTESALVDDARWEFWVNLDFSVTGANYVDVYLMADGPDLHDVTDGYFLRLGGTPKQFALFSVVGGAETKIIDGPEGQIGSSSNNTFNVRVDRTAAGLWTVEADAGATGAFQTVGFIEDNLVNDASHFGLRITQSNAAGPINSHYFDDFSVAPIPVDLTQPELLSAEALSPTEILLTFDEAVDHASAELVENYVVSAIGNPQQAVHDEQSPTLVTLILAEELVSGESYEVTATGVEDLSGNATPGTSAEFFFYELGDPDYKKLVFNEIMADPNPPVGLPDAEYLEIFNASDEFFDLQDWTLVNTTTARTLGAMLLPPGGYAILCDANNAELFESYGPTLGISSFVALANAGDSLTLLSPQGVLVDVVSYTDGWYGSSEFSSGGYSLELINPFTHCGGASNWMASQNGDGGTPGTVNSVFDDTPDTTPPALQSFTIDTDGDQISLVFDENLDEESVSTVNVSLSPEIAIVDVVVAPMNTLTVSLEAPMEIGVPYELSVGALADCEGNVVTEPIVLSLFIGATPGLHDILITEIMADPNPSVGLPEGEYFELYNTTDVTMELKGCDLSGLVFEHSTLLEPGEYAVFASAQNTVVFLTLPGVRFLENLSTTFLTNGGRELLLRNPSGEAIDRVAYDLTWYGDPAKVDGGYSLERINLEEPCRGKDNWSASIAPLGGTPLEVNSVYDDTPDTTPPSVTVAYVRESNRVEVMFTEVLDSLGVLTAEVSISPEIPITALDNLPPEYNALSITFGQDMEEGVVYELTISGVSDCMGNVADAVQVVRVALPLAPKPGDILVNEILFNPRTDASDFVEVVNVSGKALSLQGMKLINSSGVERIVTDEPMLIFPGDYVVFTPAPENLITEYPMGREENFFRMESLPAFPNAAGSVILTDALGEVLDRFDYIENYHLPMLATYKGVSLERLSFTRPTNDPGNWASAAEQVGFATPGYLNSQYMPEETLGEVTFELQDKVFSPDNDGFQDVLYINYRMDEPGFLATVRIFDRHGRPVRELTNNLVLATTGTISWDGVTDDRSKARIGPHIILIETYHPEGRTETFKLACVVAGRLSR